MERHERRSGYWFVAPAVLFFGTFSLFPILNAFYLSLYRDNMLTPKQWVGFANYISLIHDSQFVHGVVATIYFTVGAYLPIIAFGILLAVLLNSGKQLTTLYRTLIFLPVITTEVITSVIWLLIYNLNGPLNSLIGAFLPIQINWVNNQLVAMPAIILATFWYRLGYYVVLFLAGLQGIPGVYYEAAQLDGAGPWKAFWGITFPLLRPTTLFATTIAIIQGVSTFVPMLVLTNGGPGNTTTTLSLMIYNDAFSYLQFGKAAAVSVFLFVGVLIATVIQLRVVFWEGA